MKKLIVALLLILSPAVANANQAQLHSLCADIAIRYTVFTMVARDFDNKAEYEAVVYKGLSQSNASADTREILVKLIELAWVTRNEDATQMGNAVYQSCAKDESI